MGKKQILNTKTDMWHNIKESFFAEDRMYEILSNLQKAGRTKEYRLQGQCIKLIAFLFVSNKQLEIEIYKTTLIITWNT